MFFCNSCVLIFLFATSVFDITTIMVCLFKLLSPQFFVFNVVLTQVTSLSKNFIVVFTQVTSLSKWDSLVGEEGLLKPSERPVVLNR